MANLEALELFTRAFIPAVAPTGLNRCGHYITIGPLNLRLINLFNLHVILILVVKYFVYIFDTVNTKRFIKRSKDDEYSHL